MESLGTMLVHDSGKKKNIVVMFLETLHIIALRYKTGNFSNNVTWYDKKHFLLLWFVYHSLHVLESNMDWVMWTILA